MSYQVINNLFSKASRKKLNEKKQNTGGRGSHPIDLHAWQKQSKYQLQFLLNFLDWYVTQVFYIQQIKNQSLLAHFPTLKTYLFLHVMTDDQHPLC